jgi:hypothetical protein
MPEQPKKLNTAEQKVPFRERLACSVSDAVEASGISRSRLYMEMKDGRLEYLQRGSRRLVRVASLIKLLGE